MRVHRSHLPVVLALIVLAACATAGPQIETEGKLALRGIEFQRGVQAVLDAADASHAAGVVKDADLERIARIGLRLGREGGRLAAALKTVDTARDPLTQSQGIGAARAIIQTLQDILTEFPEVPPGVQSTITALSAVVTLLAVELP